MNSKTKKIHNSFKIKSFIILLTFILILPSNYNVKASLLEADYTRSEDEIWRTTVTSGIISPTTFKEKIYNLISKNKIPLINKNAVLMFTGDLMCLAGQQYDASTSDGYDFYPSYKIVSPIFNLADFVCGNLETLLSESNPITKVQKNIEGAPQCNGPESYLTAIKKAGFDCVVTANNHCCDWGAVGIIETEQHLEDYGIAHVGTSKNIDKNYVIFEVNGIKVAILSYTHLINQRGKMSSAEMTSMVSLYSEEKVIKDIQEAKEHGAEFVAVYCHWGSENTEQLHSYQKNDALAIAEAGANIILGSHPHCLQGKEIITTSDNREVVCMYSLGNFVSSMVRDINNDTIILKLVISKNKTGQVVVNNIDYIPCHVMNLSGLSSFTIVPTNESLNGGISNSTLSQAESRIRKIIGIF